MTNETALLEQIGVRFRDEGLFTQALTHSSFLGAPSNQRLEFLGDSVLQLCVSERLYARYPDMAEGELSRLRSTIVCEASLAAAARRLGLGDCLRLGRCEMRARAQGVEKPSLLADAMEAIIGAVYLDQGLAASNDCIGRMLSVELEHGYGDISDHKTTLQEWLQKEGMLVPEYRIVGMEGPAHKPVYRAEVWFGDACQGAGEGGSKKCAEQKAAKTALERLREAGSGCG